MKYIWQDLEKGWCCCVLITFLNARIYYNKPLINDLNDPYWNELAEKYCCKNGSVIGRDYAAKELGIRQIPIDRKDVPYNLPAEITAFTRVGLHSSLVIDTKDDMWTVVNFDGCKGKLINCIHKNNIQFPSKGISTDRHHKLELL